MSTPFEVPFTPGTPQTLVVQIGSRTCRVAIQWCAPAGCWVMDLVNDVDGSPIIFGLPLVTGADLLAQLEYLGLGVAMLVQTDAEPDAVPTFANLGGTSHLFVQVP